MSKEIKNDKSQSMVYECENQYFCCNVSFQKGLMDGDGYYMTVAPCKFENGKISEVEATWSDYILLIPCARRSEKNLMLAQDLMKFHMLSMAKQIIEDKKIIDKIEKEYKGESDMDDKINKMVDENKKENKKKLTFDDVIGMDEIKEKLRDIIDQLQNKQKYEEWGIDPIRGMILTGESGTGKSLISEALAGEVDAHFIKISGASILDKYVGSSGKNVQKVFKECRKYEKCILMIDEAESILAKRNSEDSGKEHNNVVNEFLVQLASLDNEGIFVIATTNRIDMMDDAIKRSGRFDIKLEVPKPDFITRKGILEHNAKKKPLADDVNFDKIARNMLNMNCADCALLINESARRVLKEKRDKITQADLEKSFEEMVAGIASKTKVLDEKQKRVIATHEIHHLLANELLKVNKTKKVSILPRGNTLGFLLHAPEEDNDKFLYTQEELENKVKVSLAGRIGEELFFGKATTGASDDLNKATSLVKTMICKYGYSKEMGLLVIDDNDLFMKEKVNELAKEMLDNLYLETKVLLEGHMDLAKKLTDELCYREELTGEEVDEIMNEFKTINY